MTALAKLFRATAFRLSLAIFGISVIGAGLLLGVVYWQVIKLFEDETMQRIDAESNRLEAIYGQGGVRRLGDAIEVRSRSPGSSLYLLTNSAGVPLAGNISQLPPGFLDRDGFVHTRYAATDGSIRNRPALAKISTRRVSRPDWARPVGHCAGWRGDVARARDLADLLRRTRRDSARCSSRGGCCDVSMR